MPNFTLPSNGNGTCSFDDFQGFNLVIFFYPKDDTSGCTKEAIGFSQSLPDFSIANTAIIGISKDTVAKHDKFIAKHDLKIPLLSDTSGQICEDCGVWKEKSMYGKTYMGIERTTLLIDKNGVIQQIWRKVRVNGHVEAVLEAAQSL
ncbi:MAG: peroxiredoxin [Amylibacter sp.]